MPCGIARIEERILENSPPARAERRMLDVKRLHPSYNELQVASRAEVNREVLK